MDEESIFALALERGSVAERSAFLDQACGDDQQLRHRIEALLHSHELAGSFLQEPAAPARSATPEPTAERPGAVIGPYVLREKIGEGGMGVVFVAEQTRPVKRKVALKVIKPGLDTKQVIARFEAERQALALMDHPNIAKVLDAGSTDAGRPFFAMDLVRGLPITEYCDEHSLTAEERLELFMAVCHAVQHAHQKGIIHRDVKPSNILVTRNGDRAVPKVIDFGVAKAINQRLTEQTIYTQFAEMIGTPLYMSPEQAELSELDVDTRSDVFSLGVVLYELLTGSTPIEKGRLSANGYDEIRRIIRDEDPPRPSDRISTLAAQRLTTVCQRRRADTDKYRQHLRGELDWIVMKALEKDRGRRYQSPASLARDLKRHLDDEPVEARPASATYRLRKFTARNKSTIAAAALILISLVVGAVESTRQAIRATSAAREAADQSERAKSALTESRLAQAELALEKGQLLAERGEVDLALLWMARSLRTAPVDAVDLRRAILVNLSAWSQQVRPLQLLAAQKEGRIDAVAYLPEQNALLTASRAANDGFLLYKLDVQNGSLLQPPMRRSRGMVTSLALDEAGATLAVGYVDGRVELVDANSGSAKELPTACHPGPISSLVFSPRGDRLLSAGRFRPIQASGDLDENSFQFRGPGLVQIVDIPSGRQRFAAPLQHDHMVWAAAFSSDGELFVTESAEWFDTNATAHTRFWNDEGMEIREPLEHSSPALALVLSADSKTLLSGHWDNRARLWSLDSGAISLEQEIRCEGPVVTAAFHPDDPRLLLLGDYGGTARIWDSDAQNILGPILWHRDLVRIARFSPDGELAICGTLGGEIRLWKVGQQQLAESLPAYRPIRFPLAIDEARKRLLAQDSDGRIQWVDAATGEAVGPAIVHTETVLRCAFSREGDIVATLGTDRVVRVWDFAAGQLVDQLKFEEPPFSVAVDPNGETVAIGCFADVAVLWDVKTRTEKSWKLRHRPHSGPVFSVCFSPDGQRILSGGADSTARLWDIRNESQIRSFTQVSAAKSASFSPDGSMIVVCGGGEGARVWNVESGSPVGLPLRHDGQVSIAQFSADGSMLLTGGMDGAARLWDVATGRQLGPALDHDGYVGRVAFWPIGDVLATVPTNDVPGSETGEMAEAQYWRLPAPIDGTDEQIKKWAQHITGMELDERGGMRFLDADAWRAGRRISTRSGLPHEAD